ncbi:hypothetical protein [Alistipes putredinis]|uniref:hypothetical protein n=1 Tax=Alistipes putredinis TaxID=28117 RepID=UPI003AB75A98
MGKKSISDKDALQFLTELQRDLLEDRRTETVQADPIYYGILDVKEFVTDQDHSDNRVLVCDDGDIEPQTAVEEELIDENLINEMLEDGILDTNDMKCSSTCCERLTLQNPVSLWLKTPAKRAIAITMNNTERR